MGIMQQMCGKVYVRPFFLGLDDPRIFLRLSRRHDQRHGDLVRQEVTKMNGDLGERPQRPQISCCLTGWSRFTRAGGYQSRFRAATLSGTSEWTFISTRKTRC